MIFVHVLALLLELLWYLNPFFRLTNTGDVLPYAGLFKLQNSTMIVGKSEGFLNFEMYPVFSVVVTTTDSGTPPLSYTGVIRIVLQNVNDQPKNITLSNNQVVLTALSF